MVSAQHTADERPARDVDADVQDVVIRMKRIDMERILETPDTAATRTDQPTMVDLSVVSKVRVDDWLDNALADTFPASDPVASPPFGPAFVESREVTA